VTDRPTIDMEALAQDLKEHLMLYTYERAQQFGMSTRGMCSALKRLGLTRKRSLGASKGCMIKQEKCFREDQGL